MAKLMGPTSPVGKRLTLQEQTGEVIGVVQDFIFARPDLEEIQPLAFRLSTKTEGYGSLNTLLISIHEGGIAEALDFIEKTWKQTIPMFPFIYSFLDEDFEQSFGTLETLGRLLTTSTFISIFISCLGLLGLATYSTQQRTKEIAIRKVLGASASGIILKLSREFTRWVVFANLIAFPTAYFVMKWWLQNFPYRISLGLWIFILSALSVLVLAILTVSFQALKAATANPVDSLRHE